MPTAVQASEVLKNRRHRGGSRSNDPVNTSGENNEPEEETPKEEAAEIEEEEPKREPVGGVHWSDSNTTEIQKRRKERYGY